MEFDQTLTKYLESQLTRRFATTYVPVEGSRIPDKIVDPQETDRIRDTVAKVGGLYGDLPDEFQLPQAKFEVQRLCELVHQSRFKGQELKIVSPVCPDYSYRIVDSRYVYDFRQLNEGIGLTAQRLLEKAPTFIERLKAAGTEVRYSILMADVEADDPLIRERVGLSREDFVGKVKNATQNLRAEAGPTGFDVRLMSSFLSHEDYSRASTLVDQINDTKITPMVFSRNNLYSKLFTPNPGEDFQKFSLERARQDITRSLVFGSAARREGVIILDTTDRQLGNFYNHGDGLPLAPLVSIEKNY